MNLETLMNEAADKLLSTQPKVMGCGLQYPGPNELNWAKRVKNATRNQLPLLVREALYDDVVCGDFFWERKVGVLGA